MEIIGRITADATVNETKAGKTFNAADLNYVPRNKSMRHQQFHHYHRQIRQRSYERHYKEVAFFIGIVVPGRFVFVEDPLVIFIYNENAVEQ